MGLLTYIIAKWRKVLLPICKRSFVWMGPIKLNVRSTWQAERGCRTKKTAMLLSVGKSSFLAALRFSWFSPWDVARLTFPFPSRIFPSDWESGVLGVDC